jgi:hypothetical protein
MLMGEWLKGRRNALIDAALIYVAGEWIVPPVVSAILYLGSSETGLGLLLIAVYYAAILPPIVLAILRAPSEQEVLESDRERERKTGKLVYVPGFRPATPFMLGSRGAWVRVRAD